MILANILSAHFQKTLIFQTNTQIPVDITKNSTLPIHLQSPTKEDNKLP
jgi:hypothetical protein